MKKKILRLGKEETKVTEEETPKKKVKGKDFLIILALASELGFSIAVPIGLGVLTGSWLDNRVGTSPVFTIALLLVGVAIGMTNLINAVRRSTNNKQEK